MGWRTALIRLAIAAAAILLVFHRDVNDMVAIWWNSSTYTHCLFILPLTGWLVWQRRDEVATLSPKGFAPGLALVALGGLAWLIGQAGGIALFRHAGIVFMLQSSVLTLLGPRVTRGLLFPFFYLVFLVPFGEEFVPPLQTITAKLAMTLLEWAAIPAHIEGVFLQTPFGLFEVAEACSGVKFLVAMVAYGALVANVCYRSIWRRAAFMAVSVIVPILANGVRAYGIIHISYLTSNAFAESVDHVIWGWMFFALVMAMVMAVGWKFFDRRIDDPWLGAWANRVDALPVRKDSLGLLVAVVAVAAIPVAWQAAIDRSARTAVAHSIALPEVPGWRQVSLRQSFTWEPRFAGADHRLLGSYANAAGDAVDLAIALYGWQEEGKELVGFGQGAFPPGSRWSWANDTKAPDGGKAERIFAPGVAREVVSFYVLDGASTGSGSRLKVQTLKTRLTGGDQAAVAILISAETSDDRAARPAIDRFIKDMGGAKSLATRMIAEARGR